MKEICTWLAIGLGGLILVVPGAHAQGPGATPSPPPTYTITLRGRDACVTPHTRMRARADGGIIDVQMSTSSIMTVTMTGTPAADSYLGRTSTATQAFDRDGTAIDRAFTLRHERWPSSLARSCERPGSPAHR